MKDNTINDAQVCDIQIFEEDGIIFTSTPWNREYGIAPDHAGKICLEWYVISCRY